MAQNRAMANRRAAREARVAIARFTLREGVTLSKSEARILGDAARVLARHGADPEEDQT